MEEVLRLRLYVGGVNGVGKTTVCKLLSEKLSLYYLSGSDMLLRYLGVETQTKLHERSEEEKIEIARKIIVPELRKRKRLVYDTHYLVISGVRIEEELFLDEYKNLFNYLVLILTDPKVIYQRRKCNLNKRERRLNLKELIYEQQRSMVIAEDLSIENNIPLIKIDNSGDDLENNVVREIIAKIKSR